MLSRLNLLRVSTLLLLLNVCAVGVTQVPKQKAQAVKPKPMWPNKARLVISISMQFEAGGQPEGSESPFSGMPLPAGQVDFIANSWFAYGYKEGVYRMLDLWKKHHIKVTSHVIASAAEKHPEVLKAIVQDGHEIAGHGMTWSSQWQMNGDEEKVYIKRATDLIQGLSGQKTIGYNCHWMRRSHHTVRILQELGFMYQTDDVSRDEPFITKVNGQNFVYMPYTLRNNDIASIEGKKWSPDQFLTQLKMEFDQLYEEGASKRRMMSISMHDRIGGTPALVKALDEFLTYAQKKSGVVFMRKDDIAKLVQNDPDTPIDHEDDPYNN